MILKKLKKISLGLGLLIIGFVIGWIASIYLLQPFNLGDSVKFWSNIAIENSTRATNSQIEALNCETKLSSVSAQMKILMEKPVPSPKIAYRTETKLVYVCPERMTLINGRCIPAVSLCY